MSDYLPEALVLEILYRLPPTTLVKCTSVCKAWNKIIKSHTFISAHLQRSLSNPSPPLLLIRHHVSPFNEQYSLYSDTISFRKIAELQYSFSVLSELFFRFIGTINGVVCLCDDAMGLSDVIILWNPLIQRHIQLPKPLFGFNELGPRMYVLGFGFDSKKNDYKVVRVYYCQGKDGWTDVVHPQVELYSLNEAAWRVIDASSVEIRAVWTSRKQCFLHGNVHWVAIERTKTAPFQRNCILMFNVEDEEFKKMKLPEELGTIRPSKLVISVIEGCLSMIEYPESNFFIENTWCNIWMSRGYGADESWSKMYSVNLEGGIRKVFGLRTGGEVLVVQYPHTELVVFTNEEPVSLYSFDPKSQKMRKLGSLCVRGTVAARFSVIEFSGSLVLLDKESDAISYPASKSVGAR